MSPELFEGTMNVLLKVLQTCKNSWDVKQHCRAVAYANALQLLLNGYGKDLHEVGREDGRETWPGP